MSLRTPLGRARGLGSAKEGVAHWWAQRLTSIALVPLAIWFVVSIAALAGADHGAVVAWLRAPVTVILMVLLVAATFHHLQLGLQVVLEDYVHTGWLRLGAIIGVKFAAAALALAALYAVLKIAFQG
ncbi:MAG: succinate dehydrogenase, hydrophobic membrane anchor protein [Alphaproteobacteria bacterium]